MEIKTYQLSENICLSIEVNDDPPRLGWAGSEAAIFRLASEIEYLNEQIEYLQKQLDGKSK